MKALRSQIVTSNDKKTEVTNYNLKLVRKTNKPCGKENICSRGSAENLEVKL